MIDPENQPASQSAQDSDHKKSKLMNSYRFKRSFSEEPTLSQSLFNLVETTFPGMTQIADLIRELGPSWEAASTPFIYFQDDRAISHVGVIEIPMILMGQAVKVAGIHGVCTHPEFRRRGYYRQVMQEVLDYCDNYYETLILTTENPEFYTPFGFRFVQEHAFVTPCVSHEKPGEFRLLNPQDPEDKNLLNRLLDQREPISNIVGVVQEKAIFCFNQATQPLYYTEDLDLIVCMEISDTQIKLFDVVGRQICSLAAILERIPQHIEEVVMYFTSDRWAPDAQAFPHLLDMDGDSFLMVRGPFPPEGQPFMLPRSARC